MFFPPLSPMVLFSAAPADYIDKHAVRPCRVKAAPNPKITKES
jgi:hypothetical protein